MKSQCIGDEMVKLENLGYLNLTLNIVALITFAVAIFQNDWFHDKTNGCREGLYARCCFDTCAHLTRTSMVQHASQFLGPAAMIMELVGAVLVIVFFTMADDPISLSTSRLISQSIAVGCAVLVAVLMASHHEYAIDNSSYELDSTFWLWIGGTSVAGVELLLQGLHSYNSVTEVYGSV